MADGQIPPPAEPQGAPPSGNVSATATCCPQVSTFDGSPRPAKVQGFDARTNLVNNRGSEEYWLPPAKAKTMPSDPYIQDGAAWASVGLNETTELEIAFEGHSGNGCLTNCTFEMSASGIVELQTTRIASNDATFRLKGLAEGETTVKVVCNGSELGWVHVVCYRMIRIRGVVATLVTPHSRPVAYDASALETMLNRVFRQSLIRFVIEDGGVINMGSDAGLAQVENMARQNVSQAGYPPQFVDGYGSVSGDALFPWLPSEDTSLADQLAPFVRKGLGKKYTGQITFIYYVPNDRPSLANGSVPEVGLDPCFVYKDFTDAPIAGYGPADTHAILAHEAGHAFGLHHPHDPNCTELPGHLTGSCGFAVADEPATNTEPAIVVGDKPVSEERNRVAIMARDPLNLMGYWPAFTEQRFIRKGQWDKCRAGAKKFGV